MCRRQGGGGQFCTLRALCAALLARNALSWIMGRALIASTRIVNSVCTPLGLQMLCIYAANRRLLDDHRRRRNGLSPCKQRNPRKLNIASCLQSRLCVNPTWRRCLSTYGEETN